MSNYIPTTDFAVKDSLPSEDDRKIIRGAEFNREFTDIAEAVKSKAGTASPTFTGTVTVNNLTVTGTLSVAKIDGGTY